jgi:hypothetical protein
VSEQLRPQPPAPDAGFSIVRVLMIVLICGGIGGGAWLLVGELQGSPVKYPFKGQVLFNGKPVTTGSVMTERVGDKFDAALGFLDSEGRFSLETNGEPGASAGTHKVIISSMAPGFPPRPLVPSIYVDLKSTPLTLEVTSDPAKNTIVFELQGELPEAPAAPAGGPGGSGPPGGGGAPGGGGPPGGGPPNAAPEGGDAPPAAAPDTPAQPAEAKPE